MHCKLPTERDYVVLINKFCTESATYKATQASQYIENQIKNLINEARDFQGQLNILNKVLDSYYSNTGPYGRYLSARFPKDLKNALFIQDDSSKPKEDVPSFEEMSSKGKRVRPKEFIKSRFKGSAYAQLYFERDIMQNMVETFLVKRSGDSTGFYSTKEELNQSVKKYKQELLDKVFAYFENNQLLSALIEDLPRKMYNDQGDYMGTIKTIKNVIDSHLSYEEVLKSPKNLDSYYMDYKTSSKGTIKANAKIFLDAYNAWILLNNFDTIVENTVGDIIKVTEQFDKHTGSLRKYEFTTKASNMWNNWQDSDDIASMADVISEVTQKLIETSRMYQWGVEEAYPDRYLSFHDFNYIIGKIKNTVNNVGNVMIKDMDRQEKLSIHTKKLLLDISLDSQKNDNDANVTWKQLISRINENPQRYLHAIFDILCNTDILEREIFKSEDLDEYAKNLIWSFNKEVFGSNSNRSLYKMHLNTKQDNIYQIITQVAASTFPEEYMQYYEKNDNSIGTRLLRDYAIDDIKNSLMSTIQEKCATVSLNTLKGYDLVLKNAPNTNDMYLEELKLRIPINNANFVLEITATPHKVVTNLEDIDIEIMNSLSSAIWDSSELQNLFKNVLGINFIKDPDFTDAFLRQNGDNKISAVKNLSEILGRALFTTTINTTYAPKHKNATTDEGSLKVFLEGQYGRDEAKNYNKDINRNTGYIAVLPRDSRNTSLNALAMAKAINNNLMAAAQSKTGEGTSIANYTLSRLRNFYHNQLEVQCRRKNSATKNMTFVVNSNNVFQGILSRREIKTLKTAQQSTKFSDEQSFQLAFINDFVSGFLPNPDSGNYLKDGKVSFLPTVNSDKSQIDGLLVYLHAKTRIPNGKGGYKTYIQLTDSEIEEEMRSEFKPFYDKVIENITKELERVAVELQKTVPGKIEPKDNSVVAKHQAILEYFNNVFGNDAINGLHKVITEYNKTHHKNPIMLAANIHYVVNKDGKLQTNKTLEALWGRFNTELSDYMRSELEKLYENETEYRKFADKNGLDYLSTSTFFKWQDYQTVKDLTDMHFKVYLRGNKDRVREEQNEIKFLRGDIVYNDQQSKNPDYEHIIRLNNEMKDWVSDSGLMIIAKGTDALGNAVEITTSEDLQRVVANLQLHPMLSKLNRLDYLFSQQYTIATVGSHYAHSAGKKDNSASVLVEEAQRWLASNKRNVAATSTVHLFQNKQLDGSPSMYNISIIEDITTDLYTVMGDLYREGHKPHDGGMFCCGWLSYLENNSLAGEAAGIDKKQFGTFYNELYGAGGIIKTAGFAVTNDRMRRSKAWQNLQKAMSQGKWLKEHPDENGENVIELGEDNKGLNITKDFLGHNIDYKQAIGQDIYYKRVCPDDPKAMAAYKQLGIIKLEPGKPYINPVTGETYKGLNGEELIAGYNSYMITEIEVDSRGVEVGEKVYRIEHNIDNNWDLYNKIFGGMNSLELGKDNRLTWSENSMRLMVHAINNVGYKKDTTKYGEFSEDLKNINTGLDQDDVWQPLKYSDIHYVPNIGAIKSLQYNVNPDGEAVLEGKAELNYAVLRLAQLGIQLDKEHYADLSEVTMPTQIIQALANKSYSAEDAEEVYRALGVLARQVSEPFLKGIQDIITSDNPAALIEEVTNVILENTLRKKGDNGVIDSILEELLTKAEKGKTIKFAKDIKGKIAWSDARITKKLFSEISTTLSNLGIKMKFSGILSVICPADKAEQLQGDRTLNSFTKIYNEDGSTRTSLSQDNLEEYQKSVEAGNEVDSDGRNMLIFDEIRDLTFIMKRNPEESEEFYNKRIQSDIRRKKLSQVSELKTQHNYVIEYSDGSKDYVTINTPIEYFNIKNLVVRGKVVGNTINGKPLITPITYEEILKEQTSQYTGSIKNNEDNDLEHIVCKYLIGNPITYESFKKELGGDKTPEMRSMLRLFRRPEKGGINIDQLAHNIWEDYAEIFPNTQDIKNKIIEVLLSKTQNEIFNYSEILVNKQVEQDAAYQYQEYEKYIQEEYNMSAEEYAERYEQYKKGSLAVVKIYEDVIKPRTLSAYNVRFSDRATGDRFQIYDLDSVNNLFNLNSLKTEKPPKGYKVFQELTPQEQKAVLKKLFNYLHKIGRAEVVKIRLEQELGHPVPIFDDNFIDTIYYNPQLSINFNNIIDQLYKITKPIVYRNMQKDLFKLSPNYKPNNSQDIKIWVNNKLIEPIDIQTDAYELIMPKIYQTQFGLQEFDDLQEILKDEDFFIKRGLSRFKCKLEHSSYDYELKNFNGEHIYILDANKEIPEHIANNVLPIFKETKKGKLYRTTSDGENIYELSSEDDTVCKIGDTQIIVTKNPLFYVQSLNYNTLKVSPERVTEESYQALIEDLSKSKRLNSKNFLKAISLDEGYLPLNDFKQFNIAIDNINYDNVFLDESDDKDFTSVAQLCRIIINNGRELHTAFKESLNIIAGRIPAQSQQSFMTQKVVAFDNSNVNTAMVSTFQLFLQGSDLDIDAVTLLGYSFDKNGKFIGWSPYFKPDSAEKLRASKLLPLPTGKKETITIDKDAKTNFFEIFDKYFGTLFQPIKIKSGKNKTENGVQVLQINIETPENIKLLAEFLRDFNRYGISIKGEVVNGKVIVENSGEFKDKYNLFKKQPFGLGFRPNQIQAAAEQLLEFANEHNDYINIAEEYERNEMAKNFIVNYIYKVSGDPCNQTEAMQGIDEVTKDVKNEAENSAMNKASDSYAPGRTSAKIKSVGEGQAGKQGVGIGAVAIKANSTTQFYLSELWRNGSEQDKNKILFRPKNIMGTQYTGFANMYTTAEFSEEERQRYESAIKLLEGLQSETEVTKNVSLELSSLLSISVDNAKDLALAKINAGPRLMGIFAYGLSIGISIKDLARIMTSKQGLILKRLSEGSYFNNDNTSFRVLDIFDKLDGNISSDINKISMYGKDGDDNTVKMPSDVWVTMPNGRIKQLSYGNTKDALFIMMYDYYEEWFDRNKNDLIPKGFTLASSLEEMFVQLKRYNMFNSIYKAFERDEKNIKRKEEIQTFTKNMSKESRQNWEASLKQLVQYLSDIESMSSIMQDGNIGESLRVLAEGAEEMRILGQILGINKGLKPTMLEMEAFIDTIENLIYDRLKAMGSKPTNEDKIDFMQFMLDENYQKEIIEKYESIKHSVNIPHLLSKVPHFNEYLKLQLIPQAFFNVASVSYRTLYRYRKNVYADNNNEAPVSLFNFFGVDGKKDKEAILRGFENMINFKMFAKWAYDNQITFKVPKGFKYFTAKEQLTSNNDVEVPINLWTLSGFATFKKYMEEVYIPTLQDSSVGDNEFVKNLEPYELDRTANHDSIRVYSLPGDLMDGKGRQGELNKERFAAFKVLSTIPFQSDSKIASAVDAFFIYSQYCYSGKKSQKSLLSVFDDTQCELSKSFTQHVATMDDSGVLSCSPEEIIIWCAPEGTQFSSAKYIYGILDGKFGKQLLIRNNDRAISKNEDVQELQQAAMESLDVDDPEIARSLYRESRYSLYKGDYSISQYDRLTRNNFLVPSTTEKVQFTVALPLKIDNDQTLDMSIIVRQDMITDIQSPLLLDPQTTEDIAIKLLDNYVKTKSMNAEGVSKYNSWEDFKQDLLSKLKSIHIPYKVQLYGNSRRELNMQILNKIIEQQLQC